MTDGPKFVNICVTLAWGVISRKPDFPPTFSARLRYVTSRCSMHEFHITDSRRQQMEHSTARLVHESHDFPGHEQRLAEHTRRIYSTSCECGSGKSYGECCLHADHQRSSAQTSYSMPRSVHADPMIRWKLEDSFRMRAFGVFYKAGQEEHGLLVRFIRAIVASAGPIRNNSQLRQWLRRFHAPAAGKNPETSL